MRDLILKRIAEYKETSQGFSHSSRWGSVKPKNGTTHFGYNGTHISTLDFSSVPDEELLALFERIVRRYFTQM